MNCVLACWIKIRIMRLDNVNAKYLKIAKLFELVMVVPRFLLLLHSLVVDEHLRYSAVRLCKLDPNSDKRMTEEWNLGTINSSAMWRIPSTESWYSFYWMGRVNPESKCMRELHFYLGRNSNPQPLIKRPASVSKSDIYDKWDNSIWCRRNIYKCSNLSRSKNKYILSGMVLWSYSDFLKTSNSGNWRFR